MPRPAITVAARRYVIVGDKEQFEIIPDAELVLECPDCLRTLTLKPPYTPGEIYSRFVANCVKNHDQRKGR